MRRALSRGIKTFKVKKAENGLIKGAVVLSLGGFVTKIIGAVYRIPLTNILGAEGIGLYQMVFPFYSLLLTLSSSGVPNGIAKIIAGGGDPETTLKSALKAFTATGAAASVIMALASGGLASAQGNYGAKLSYAALSPSVFLVGIISCYRGYFQGFSDMKPTAVSQIAEQSVKLAAGLSLCRIFKNDTVKAAACAALAVTVSEITAAIYFMILKKKRGFSAGGNKKITVKTLLKTVAPVMLSTIIFPLSKTVESFFIINLLGVYSDKATSLYGLYSGAAESLTGVPVALLYGFAASAVPVIASELKSGNAADGKIRQSLLFTFSGGVICGALLYVFAPLAVKILYPKLSAENAAITVKLLKIGAFTVIFLPLVQTTAAVLIASGNCGVPPVTAFISAAVKIALTVFLIKNPDINILGAVIGDGACYLLACFLNLMYIIYDCKVKFKIKAEKIAYEGK